jgi:DNA-binding transcriptional regulator YiaG
MARTKSEISTVPLDRTQPHHDGVLYVEGIPKTTKRAFKAACVKNGEAMRDVVIKFMRKYVQKSEAPFR